MIGVQQKYASNPEFESLASEFLTATRLGRIPKSIIADYERLAKTLQFFGGSRNSQNSDWEGPKIGRKRSDFAVWVCFKHTAIWFVKAFVSTGFSGGCANWLWFKESGGGKKMAERGGKGPLPYI